MAELDHGENLPQLLIPNHYKVSKQIDEVRKGLTDTQVGLMRRMAKTNLFFLANTILKYPDLTASLHGHLCAWLDATRYSQYRLVLLPRFHFKTTVVTISDSIQLALPDDTGLLPYPFNLGPNIRIGIAHEGALHAANFLQSIANHALGNPLLLALFPEILPGQDQRKNSTQLELPRTAFWSEPTFEAFGVGTKAQGRHYNVLKPDDIYGDAARDSETVHRRAIKWLDGITSLLTNIRTDKIDFSGTRYGYNDAYAHIFEVYNPIGLKTYVRSVWERDEKGNFLRDEKKHLIPIFPERISWESMQPIMADRENYETNFLNDPSAGSSEFEESWLRHYDNVEDKWDKFSYRDLDGTYKEYDLMELDRVILVDPATTGLSGIVVTGTTSDRDYKVFVLEELQEQFSTDEFVNKLFALAIKWKVRTIAIEDVLFSVLYQTILEREMIFRRLRGFTIVGVKTGGRHKEDRVRGLSKWFSNGQILLKVGMDKFATMIRRFPSGKDYHSLDALAQGPAIWRRAAGAELAQKREDALAYLMEQRNPITGYSR